MDSQNIKTTNNDSRCVFFNEHSEDYRCVVILTVKRATGTFSLVGCLFMLFVIWLLRRYHSLAQKMILSLTVAAFFDSVAYVMGESHPEGSLCDFQAWWLTYFDWSALAWVCLITLNLYLNLVREISTNRYEMLYHVTAWGVPLVMASLPLLKGYYGPAGFWCWITDDHVAWRFGIWYVPLFSLIFLMICCYARIICVANKRMQSWLGTFNPERERRKVSLAEEIKPLKWYPSVYLLVSIFPLINSQPFLKWAQKHLVLHNAFYPLNPSFSLTLLHVMSAPLHGLANAFVFGLDRDWWSLLSPTGMQLALQSRLCDRTRIGEYHPGAVRYTQADLADLSDDDDDDTNVLFYSPDMTLKDRGP
ncbi:cyclic AMP receptor-like protein A isoform X2 [Sphaeramia orbicularis]|uniref:cyclic AMP receptor-like protein A isoform X2 n=1 Tax=Sphaeramia orbicularis TaxID=375764 RepID=UPI00117C0737|nr:cyclic AMP receptor-like protein A isoform X2 [Sphaeramia orbicularis]